MRKIIQFALSPIGKVIALADDGSLWIKEDEWFRIKPLPEDSSVAGSSSADESVRGGAGAGRALTQVGLAGRPVERRVSNPEVGGSIPSSLTKIRVRRART